MLSLLISGEKYGREIRLLHEKRTGKPLPIGSLYTTLDRMEAKGLVTSRDGDADDRSGGFRRRYFKITANGVRAYEAARDRMLGLARLFGAPIRGGR